METWMQHFFVGIVYWFWLSFDAVMPSLLTRAMRNRQQNCFTMFFQVSSYEIGLLLCYQSMTFSKQDLLHFNHLHHLECFSFDTNCNLACFSIKWSFFSFPSVRSWRRRNWIYSRRFLLARHLPWHKIHACCFHPLFSCWRFIYFLFLMCFL